MLQVKKAQSLRILVFCGGSYVFGLEKRTLALMTGLQRKGHELFCITSAWNDGEFPRRLRSCGIPFETVRLGKITRSLRPVHAWWMVNTLAHWPLALIRCWQRMRRFRPDVIILANRDTILLTGLLLDPAKTIHRVGELSDDSTSGRRIYKILDRKIGHYVAVSENIRQRLLALDVDPKKVSVVYNGVAAVSESEVRRNEDAQRPAVIGIVGQVGEWKGHDDLVEALHILASRGVDFRCSVFGSGEAGYVGSLKRKIDRYQLASRVDWHGFVGDTDAIYRAIDVCVVPSRFAEPAANVVLEASMRGLPVVVTRRGGLPELVDDAETGFVIEPNCPTELADRIERLVTEPRLRRLIGETARKRANMRFRAESMTDNFEKICYATAARQ